MAEDRIFALPSETRIGLPARHLVVVPLWLQTGDASVFREMIRSQLERRGFLGAGEAAWDHLLVAQEGARSLVAAFLVNPSLPSELLAPQAGGYEAAARCRPLPENGCVLWKEHGGIALAAARSGNLAFLHFLPSVSQAGDVVPELLALRRALAWEKILSDAAECVLQGEWSGGDAAALASVFGKGIRQEPLPNPVLPSPFLALVPPSVRIEKHRRLQSGRARQFALCAAAVYGLLVVGALGALGWRTAQVRSLAGRVQASRSTVDRLSETAKAWQAVSPAIDASYYPLDCLLACTQVLPPDVRFTDFEHSPDKVLILGEGKDAASIFRFLDAVKGDPFLKRWTWAMPQPTLLPNNRAQFHLEGTRATPTAH